ncbi:hypothetical protein QBC37DRAFT_84534 [Rhypophila decipiens]|uniref:Uncharacterized protein n=1 Tax=Rhypophila decipiens TaxID=261697 RepID=A0AAN6YCB7_9PEZI|nr:hypothetical protein QBC37DRAFT_84534 [Rhypophila decipiens]
MQRLAVRKRVTSPTAGPDSSLKTHCRPGEVRPPDGIERAGEGNAVRVLSSCSAEKSNPIQYYNYGYWCSVPFLPLAWLGNIENEAVHDSTELLCCWRGQAVDDGQAPLFFRNEGHDAHKGRGQRSGAVLQWRVQCETGPNNTVSVRPIRQDSTVSAQCREYQPPRKVEGSRRITPLKRARTVRLCHHNNAVCGYGVCLVLISIRYPLSIQFRPAACAGKRGQPAQHVLSCIGVSRCAESVMHTESLVTDGP